jgi:hypothetical protein
MHLLELVYKIRFRVSYLAVAFAVAWVASSFDLCMSDAVEVVVDVVVAVAVDMVDWAPFDSFFFNYIC